MGKIIGRVIIGRASYIPRSRSYEIVINFSNEANIVRVTIKYRNKR